MRIINFISIIFIVFSCKKTSKKPVVATNTDEVNFTSIGQPIGKFGKGVVDIDANAYKTIIIGNQEWMAENLNVSKYNDGTPIPNESDTIKWFKLEFNAWMNNRPKAYDNMKYGKLYNGFVVDSTLNGNKNVCPTGWHIPSDQDWTILSDYLGGANVAVKMKEVGEKHWKSNKNATNASLFTALPAGVLYETKDSSFAVGNYTAWWSSTKFVFNTFYVIRSFSDNEPFLENTQASNLSGLSIRCVKD